MSFKDLQAEYIETLRVAGYSTRTLKHVRKSTGEFLEYLTGRGTQDPLKIETLVVREYALHLKARKISGVYLANKYTDCRRFLGYLHEEGWTKEDFSLVFGKVRRIKPLKTVLMQSEVADLLMQPNITTQRGIRDRALLELLYSSGLRREEVAGLELYDLNMSEGLVKVTGKGNKQRLVPVGKFALYWIHKYIKEVRGVARDQYLFVGLQTRKKMHVESIGYIVKQCGKDIKKKITPHALRHACATHMMQNGAPSTMVQAFLGHEQLMTTQIYTHVLDEDLKAVMSKFHPRRWINVPNNLYRGQDEGGSSLCGAAGGYNKSAATN